MRLKVISLLLFSSILLSGCGNSKTVTNSPTSTNKDVSTVSKASNAASSAETKGQTPSNIASNDNKDVSLTEPKAPALNETQKSQINDKVVPVVTSINKALSSMEKIKTINIKK